MTRLSNRQYPMLHTFATAPSTYFMTIDEARGYDQRPFRSMLIQKWIDYKKGKGFYITKEGRRAWYEFGNTDISRKHPELPLTKVFDPEIYGLAIAKRPKPQRPQLVEEVA